MYSNILVTGGAGFVGSNLAISFKKDFPQAHVVVLDNLKRRGSELNLARLREHSIEFRHGDIRNPEDLESDTPVDLLVECSAEPSVLAGYQSSPAYLINTNLSGTINCLELVRKHQADIVFLSTSRVYPVKAINQLSFREEATRFALDENPLVPGVSKFGFSEDFPLTGARSLYGTTKLASELILAEYIEMYQIRGIINRCGVLTGPWQMGKVDQGVIVLWLARHIFGGNLSYIGYGGTGKQVRDILHVNDLYDLLKLQLDQISLHNGQVYNVGGGLDISVSLQELTTLCQDITGKKIPISSVSETREADLPYFVTDSRVIQNKTHWKPQLSVKTTLEEIASWIEENADQLKPILS